MRRVYLTLATALLSVIAAPANATRSDASKSACLNAAAAAETRFDIPEKLLQAITLVETGHSRDNQFTAWPWTTNLNSKGRYFASKAAARRFIQTKTVRGFKSIDIGCFQINTKWHSGAFDSPEELLDPALSADYAARFLKKLKAETGSWDIAVKHYHSRDVAKGAHYGRKIASMQVKLATDKTLSKAPTIAPPPLRDQIVNAGGVSLTLFSNNSPLISAKTIQPLIQDTRK